MHLQIRCSVRVEIFQHLATVFKVEVEGAIHEFDTFHTAREQALEFRAQARPVEYAYAGVNGRDAILAAERAAARGLEIGEACREIMVGIERIGQRQPHGIGWRGVDDFLAQRRAGEHSAAKVGEGEVGFAADDEVGERRQQMRFGLVADLRAAEDECEPWCGAAQRGEQRGSLRHIPDINTEADNARRMLKNFLCRRSGRRLEIEFQQGGVGPELTEIGLQIAQTERGVLVARRESC